MKKLNKDSSVLENTVEAYLGVCLSDCWCNCSACENGPASPSEIIRYGTMNAPMNGVD